MGFQSTRPRGARLPNVGMPDVPRPMAFQSTRPRGARQTIHPCDCRFSKVSIHAPTRGATCRRHLPYYRGQRFNPRAHAGRDAQELRHRQSRIIGFNPRAHAGRDASRLYNRSDQPCFNPRAHAGRDLKSPTNSSYSVMFQSTRPRGARQMSATRLSPTGQFQSTRPRGARHGYD